MNDHRVNEHFADRLLAACFHRRTPICVGLDPVYERLPAALLRDVGANCGVNSGVNSGGDGEGVRGRVDALRRFCSQVLQTVAPHVPCVKIQAACFERYQWLGVEALRALIGEARGLGLIVILDAKRGDIGISSAHYAAGCLADARYDDLGALPGPDALTINPYMGLDTIEPFIDTATAAGKGLFALVRTSNPGSDAIQNLALAQGGTVAQAMAGMIAAAGDKSIGQSGYSLLGAVVGATKPDDAARLRELMPRQIFLVPGFGAQGGTADDVRACFNADGAGAIITASRSILYAYEKSDEKGWAVAVEKATIRMKSEIEAILG
ncbi:MAG: orotidine-5'-phosphate decarboxylase [Phycisphaeraceae bacterium]